VIKYRLEGWRFLSAMGNPHGPALIRKAMLFNDSGFMDGWFLSFRPQAHAIRTAFRVGSMFFFAFTFVPLFAFAHACIFGGLSVAVQLFAAGAEQPNSPVLRFTKWAPWLAVLVLIASHIQF